MFIIAYAIKHIKRWYKMRSFNETRYFNGVLHERVEKDYRNGCLLNSKHPDFKITQHGRVIKYWVVKKPHKGALR